MFVKFGDLNFDLYLLHLTNTYTYGVTIAPRMHDTNIKVFFFFLRVILPKKKNSINTRGGTTLRLGWSRTTLT